MSNQRQFLKLLHKICQGHEKYKNYWGRERSPETSDNGYIFITIDFKNHWKQKISSISFSLLSKPKQLQQSVISRGLVITVEHYWSDSAVLIQNPLIKGCRVQNSVQKVYRDLYYENGISLVGIYNII